MWNSHNPHLDDLVLTHEELEKVLSDQGPSLENDSNESPETPPKFLLISVFGEPESGKEAGNKLLARTKSLNKLLHLAGLRDQRHVSRFIDNKIPCTYTHVEYKADGETPASLTVLFLCPKRSNNILGAVRVDIKTRNCFAFISSRFEGDSQDIISRCRRNVDLLQINPLYLLMFIYENRIQRWTDWFEESWRSIIEAETVTDMILPQWRLTKKQLDTISDSDKLLTQLHKTHIELSNSHGVISFGQAFGDSCIKAAIQIEDYRKSLGYTPLPTRDLNGLEEDINMMHSQSESMKSRMTALSSRLSGMINVSFNLIAKRDSKVNVAIARLQARESRTVKGISILTFSLLPATFLATLWTTNLFQLEGYKNWLVFIGSVLGLTLFVFACSYVYGRVARKLEETRWPDASIMDTLTSLPPA
ncbi:unnamed protein product [Clonostachys rosea]|uniref:Uncharacterized protein n=1 Tax=Bionectria ochroleuca TaxID=29856 RepID=A0ABY6U0R8_BIOOC|nr:unnamed protein product [Clonostachys rosea]